MQQSYTKRVLVFLLAALMAFMSLMPAFAQNEDGAVASMYTNSYELSGIDGVGNVLTRAASADDAVEDNSFSFSYLSIQGKTASVGLNNAAVCSLVVAVYSEEDGRMLGSGSKTIEANIFETTVDVEIDTMPEYFIIKAFLLDENMMALCKPFSVIEYSKQFEVFDQKTVDDFGDNIIINFDEQKDDNFAVLVDGATELKSNPTQNTLVSHDEKTGEYVFANANQFLTALKKGDVFEFESNGELYLLKVKSINVSGSTVTILEDLDATHSDYFQYIDVDESPDPSGSDMTVDMTNADDNIELEGISEWEEEASPDAVKSKIAARNALVDVDETWSVGPEWKIGEKYLVGDKNSAVNVKVSGKIKAALGFNIRIYYDADWEWKWDFWNSYSDYFYCQVKIDFKISGSVTLSGAVSHDFYLGDIGFVTPVGIVVSINVKLHVEASLSITIGIDAIKVTIGFKYDEDSGFQNLCSGPTINLSPKLEGQAEFKVGLVLGPGISFVKVIEISLEPEAGAKITLKTDVLDAAQLLNLKSVDFIHTCNWFNCFNGDIRLYLSCKLKGRIFSKSKDTTIAAERTWKLCDCNLKISPFQFSFKKCSEIAYRCDFTVVNRKKKPIKNIDVISGGPDLNDHYQYNVQNATDDSGNVSFFYPKGSYTAKFILNGQEVVTKKITVADTTKKITVTIDTTETDGGGSGHNGGTGGSNLLNFTATFNANGGAFADGTTTKSLTVKAGDPIIPPNDPVRSNYSFAGWSPTIPDKMPSGNTTFTATWNAVSTGTQNPDNLTTGDHLQFGTYPQSRVTDEATISKLDAASKTWASYGYYSGTGAWFDGQMTPGDFMQFADFKVDGVKYRAVKIDEYRPRDTCGARTAQSSNQDDNYYRLGTYYFKYEPLSWRVLDASTGYVMCESCVDAQAYQNTAYRTNDIIYQGIGSSIFACDYATSSIRDWLNYEFYETAFTDVQKANIKTTVLNNDSPYSTTWNSAVTKDKIFLLSYTDATNSVYGFDNDPARYAQGTDYAKSQGLIFYNRFGKSYDQNSSWWLRSPAYFGDACFVDESGGTFASTFVTSTTVGVCPACRLSNLTSDISQSDNLFSQRKNSGTKLAPKRQNLVPSSTAALQHPPARTAAPAAQSISRADAVKGEEYVLLVVKDANAENPLAPDNLLYIDQQTAESETVTFAYLPREDFSGAVATIYGPDKDSHVHKFGEWTVTTPATVDAEGEETRTCSVCGKKETRAIPKLTPEMPEYTKGDVDGDGEVTSGDARLALRASVKLEQYEEGSAAFLAADVDGNGAIESSDARTILRVSVKLEAF